MMDLFNNIVESARRQASTPLILQMIQWKVEHTARVVNTGKKIMSYQKIEGIDDKRAEMALLLHDVGRFEQALKGSYSDTLTGIDHAILGAKILIREGVVDKEIIEAVRDHSLVEYIGDNIYTKLVKDADQLTIMGEEYQLEKVPEQVEISVVVKDVLVKKQRLDTALVQGRIDLLLAYWNWREHFFWEGTKKLYEELGHEELFRDKLRSLDPGGKNEKWLRENTKLLATTV